MSTDNPWVTWRDGVFGDPYLVWHDGPDFARLLKLARKEPATVARMVAAGLAEDDPLAAQSIAALAAEGLMPSDGEALLRAAAPAATGTFLVRVAQALHMVTGEESWADQIASVLVSDAFWGVRIDAAIALARFAPTARLIKLVDQAANSEDYLVRYHATNTLRRWRRLDRP